MVTESAVNKHYSNQSILQAIDDAMAKTGKSLSQATVSDLGPIDEFHTGGRVATAHLIDQLEISPESSILDIGCGIGGTARYLAERFGSKVTGVDMTSVYVEAACELNKLVSLDNLISVSVDDATTVEYPENNFSHALMLHVGMNIKDKSILFKNVFRVLRPGGTFAIYDVMQLTDDIIRYPVPWASNTSMSFLETSENYLVKLKECGFTATAVNERGEFAKSFFTKMKSLAQSPEGPPAVGLQVLVGPSLKERMTNFSAAVFNGTVQPTEIIAVKN